MLYEEYTPNDVPFSDNKLAISFETAEMMEETLVLLRYVIIVQGSRAAS